MTRFFSLQNGRIAAFGDTYAVRNRLKEYGGRWSAEQKCWLLPQSPAVMTQLIGLGFQNDSALTSTSESSAPPDQFFTETVQAFEPPEFSVSKLCQCIQAALERVVPPQFWIVGELCEARQSRGHFWLEVADAHSDAETLYCEDARMAETHEPKRPMRPTASITAVIWSGVLRRLAARVAPQELPLQTGLRVRLLAHAEFRPDGGKIQIIVDDVDLSYTQGQLALSREQILLELRRRGLLERNRQLALASFPMRIALVTADQSRARNDFLHELQSSTLSFDIVLHDCRMQGPETSPDVCAALKSLCAPREGDNRPQHGFDVIVITRGGGSRMDLRWFDDLEIAKLIAYANVPVITAIGHHDDVSVADAVAWKAEKTPTAAARFLIQRCVQSESDLMARLVRASQRALARVENTEQNLLARVTFLNQFALRRMVAAEQNLLTLIRQITQSAMRRCDRALQSLEQNERLLRIMGNQLTRNLERGFALIASADPNHARPRFLRAEDFLHADPPTSVNIMMATRDGHRHLKLQAKIEKTTEEITENDC